jgi:transcription elongation GreA/GreB family factor
VGVVDDSEANVADGVQLDADAGLLAGDRIVIRYLDDPRSRQECYILTDKANDQLNGLLSLSSPLAKALSDALPGDEVSLFLGDRERTVIFMSLHREPRKVAA